MPSKPRTVVTGVRSIDRKLRALPLKVQKKVAKSAIRSGMKLVAKAVKQTVPVLTGITKAHVRVLAGLQGKKKRAAGTGSKRDVITLDVRIDANMDTIRSTKSGKHVFYPAIVEYKHDHFMLRAFRMAGDAARRLTLRLLKQGVEKEAKGR